MPSTNSRSLRRRTFLRGSLAALTTVSILPASVLGLRGAESPNNKLNLACIGVGGRGRANVDEVQGENIVALCDVDADRAADIQRRHPQAKVYRDFRRLFDEMEKSIDAVVVATPDHTHAVAVMRALKSGKHVFCEKPLAHSIHEVRALRTAARERRVATQLGNQGHATDSIRNFCEWIWDGAIGTVREVHAFCSSSYGRIALLDRLQEEHAVPAGLDWDLWLGPTAARPYNPVFLPGKWRGWSQFGTGVIGDWTCHVLDPVFWALDLGAPATIEAETFDYDPRKHFETFPSSTIVRYEFPARGKRPPVKVIWYDGKQRPARPEELDEGVELPGIGALVVGDKGKIMYGSHGAGGAKLIPADRMMEYRQRMPAKTLPRSPGHHREWIAACKGGKPALSDFEYGGALTEIALLGAIAIRQAGSKLRWDGAAARFTNSAEANELIATPYRKGWSL